MPPSTKATRWFTRTPSGARAPWPSMLTSPLGPRWPRSGSHMVSSMQDAAATSAQATPCPLRRRSAWPCRRRSRGSTGRDAPNPPRSMAWMTASREAVCCSVTTARSRAKFTLTDSTPSTPMAKRSTLATQAPQDMPSTSRRCMEVMLMPPQRCSMHSFGPAPHRGRRSRTRRCTSIPRCPSLSRLRRACRVASFCTRRCRPLRSLAPCCGAECSQYKPCLLTTILPQTGARSSFPVQRSSPRSRHG